MDPRFGDLAVSEKNIMVQALPCNNELHPTPTEFRSAFDFTHLTVATLSDGRLGAKRNPTIWVFGVAALLMYQSLYRNRPIKAWCRLCSHDMEEFEIDTNHKTTNHGLGMDGCV